MKTLYVSDLDGTLLRSDETISDFTSGTIQELARKGMLFSYATARSYVTSRKVTRGLHADLPLIVYNGALVIDQRTGEIMISNFFEEETAREMLRDLLSHGIYPIVYAFADGVERFAYVDSRCTRGVREFVDSRRGDPRDFPVGDEAALFEGRIFYFACIDEPHILEPLYEKYKDTCHAIFHRDIYSGEQWLEFLPAQASKSHAALQLKERLGCDKLVVFGDGKNDIDMFEQADEGYAVENAAPELKAVATGVIGPNSEDAVARWLLRHAQLNPQEP